MKPGDQKTKDLQDRREAIVARIAELKAMNNGNDPADIAKAIERKEAGLKEIDAALEAASKTAAN